MTPLSSDVVALLMTVEWVDPSQDGNALLWQRELRARQARERLWPYFRVFYRTTRSGREDPVVRSFLERWFRLAHLPLSDEGRAVMARHRMIVVAAFLEVARARYANLSDENVLSGRCRVLDDAVRAAVLDYWGFVKDSDELNLEEQCVFRTHGSPLRDPLDLHWTG
ncbi:hypothetical protein EXIGLDRAFT_779613, partial [Exidia glandulosa HHB12029]